jgi:hypothetical protein
MSCGNVHGIARGPANGGVGAPSDDGMLLPASPIPIAIVGMACRFSGKVTNPSQLWDLCAAGKDGWSPIPESRFDGKGLYYPSYGRRGRVRWQLDCPFQIPHSALLLTQDDRNVRAMPRGVSF